MHSSERKWKTPENMDIALLSTTILSINSHNGNSCSLFFELLNENQTSVYDESIDLMLNYAIPITIFTSEVKDTINFIVLH